MSTEATPPAEKGQFGRRIRFLAIGAAAAIILVTAGWFAARAVYQNAISDGRAMLERDGLRVVCSDEGLGGFPARFEWRCGAAGVTFPNEATLSGGDFVTVAPIWNPLFTIGEWDGPFRVRSAEGLDATVESDLLRMSVRLAPDFSLRRLSAVMDDISLRLQDAPQSVANAQSGQLHIRQPEPTSNDPSPGSENHLDVAIFMLGFESPLLNGVDTIDFTVAGLVNELATAQGRSLTGLIDDWIAKSGEVRGLGVQVRLDEHAINLDGDGRIAVDRLVDFEGTISTNDVAALVDLFGVSETGMASAITAGATIFGRPVTIADSDGVELPLKVERGFVRVGPVPLGQLPPVPF